MPYSICNKLNVEPNHPNFQLYHSNVNVLGELKSVLIKISSNPKVNQTMYIVVVNFPMPYGMLLSRN